jgi:hypothetical protein
MSKITIDTLAGMMKTSFEYLEKMIKNGFEGVDKRFEEVDKRFDTIEIRLEKLENGQERRITKLEDDMRMVKTALGK